MSTLSDNNNSTPGPGSGEHLLRGWYWLVEPAKTVLATYQQGNSKALSPKCLNDHGFFKDSNGTGKSTYGCFKCKKCFTEHKASLFWTLSLSLPENILPANKSTCHQEKSATLPEEADDIMLSATENKQLLICSTDESLSTISCFKQQ
ncbi:hypothetical protein K7432_016064 [Basidiobolus ranarum]|uniref:Uncharacterized protein n=1 Tax=Basidiobolus ranarum TaxID=34480 RepID=A0ABR2WFE8_9FUNG